MPATVSPIHRLDVDDVLRMVEAGILDEHARVELVEGVLVDMQPIGAPHDNVLSRLNGHFARHTELAVRIQSMLLTEEGNGYVLPDLTVTDVLPRREHPHTAHLAVELAETSHRRDEEKIAVYAGLGVTEYWIIDLKADRIRVLRGPRPDGYDHEAVFAAGDEIDPLLEDVPPVDVTWLLAE